MITITRCFQNAAALAVLCCALAWSVTVASAEDRVLAHWDMSSPDADARIIPGTANSEAGDLKFTAASTAMIQKDASPHEYRWNMILEDDLIAMPDAKDLPTDLTLGEKGSAPDKSRRMLVRILQSDGADAAKPAFLETDEVPNPPQPAMKISKLSVIANSVAPNFKVLLFPHAAGAEIPTTTFNKDRTQLTVKWSDQTDVLTFTPDPDGRTRISLSRNTK